MAEKVIHNGMRSILIMREPETLVVKQFFHSTDAMISEIEIHNKLSGIPGVVRLIDIEPKRPNELVMEYCTNGPISKYMERRIPFTEEELLRHFRSMIATVRTIHQLGIAHRALIADNWLVASNEEIKLTDFGSAIPISTGRSEFEGDAASHLFVQDARMLGLVFLQIASRDFTTLKISRRAVEQRLAECQYSSKVKDCVRALLLDERGCRQTDVMSYFNEQLDFLRAEDPDDVLMYPMVREYCSNFPCSNLPRVQLPCAHYFCPGCIRGHLYNNHARCPVCDFMFSEEDVPTIHPGALDEKQYYNTALFLSEEIVKAPIHTGKDSVLTKKSVGLADEVTKLFITDNPNVNDEIDAHTKLDGIPGVVKLFRSSTQPPKELVMEYCEYGPLPTYMRQRGNYFSETELLRHCWLMIKTVREVHKRGFVHRTLTGESWLVTVEGQFKLSSFGHAKFVGDDLREEHTSSGPTKALLLQDARMLGRVILQLATLDFAAFAVTPENIAQHLAGSPYTDTVKDIISALLLNERGANQIAAMRHLYNLYELEELDDPEDVLMYPFDRDYCSNYPCMNPPQVQLPCTHSFCMKCMQGYTHFNSVTCRICNRDFPDDSSTTISHSADISESTNFSLLLSDL